MTIQFDPGQTRVIDSASYAEPASADPVWSALAFLLYALGTVVWLCSPALAVIVWRAAL